MSALWMGMAAPDLEGGRALAGIGLFVLVLAGVAAPGGRVGEQAFEGDVLAAIDAVAEAAPLQALARRLDVAQLVDLTVNDGSAEVRQHVGHRLVARVRHPPSQIDVMLLAGSLQLVARLGLAP